MNVVNVVVGGGWWLVVGGWWVLGAGCWVVGTHNSLSSDTQKKAMLDETPGSPPDSPPLLDLRFSPIPLLGPVTVPSIKITHSLDAEVMPFSGLLNCSQIISRASCSVTAKVCKEVKARKTKRSFFI